MTRVGTPLWHHLDSAPPEGSIQSPRFLVVRLMYVFDETIWRLHSSLKGCICMFSSYSKTAAETSCRLALHGDVRIIACPQVPTPGKQFM